MGWIRDAYENLRRQGTIDWLWGHLAADQTPDGREPQEIGIDDGYVTVRLTMARIVDRRKGRHRVHGIVHSFVDLAHRETGRARFATVTLPEALQGVDADALSNVVQMNYPLVGPVPYRGGGLEIEAGLVVVRSKDLVGPYLEVLSSLGSAAGVSVASIAKPFIDPLLNGFDLLMNSGEADDLVLGLATTFEPLKTGYFVVARLSSSNVRLSELRLNRQLQLERAGNSVTNAPYFVIEISVDKHRSNWFALPNLIEAYQELQREVRSGRGDRVDEARLVFRRIAMSSPDLIQHDAELIVQKVNEEVAKALPPTATAKRASASELPSLENLDPFE